VLQYKQLEQLYQKYGERGLAILAFPCNQFGGQEPANGEQIKAFVAALAPPVSFPLFAKVMVNGNEAHPLFVFLKDALPGVLGTTAIKWNFTKFLLDRDGAPVKRFGTTQPPFDMESLIIELLDKVPSDTKQ